MRVAIDTNILVRLISTREDQRLVDPRSGEEIDRTAERAAALVMSLEERRATLIIPSPVLAEFLVGVEPEQMQTYIDAVQSVRCIEVAPFDDRAAIECALLVDELERRQLSGEQETKAKVRFDRQIIAIAKVAGAHQLYSHDRNLLAKARAAGLNVRTLADVPVPPSQGDLLRDQASAEHG